ITCDELKPQIRIVDGVKCFSCHKNKGPILGQGPWSNTPHNDVVRQAIGNCSNINLQALCLPDTIGQPRSLNAGFEGGIVRQPAAFADGMSLVIPQGPAVDAGVRLGADIIRDRDVYRQMTRTGDGRRALQVLLTAIVSDEQLDVASQKVQRTVDQTFADYETGFAPKWVKLHEKSTDTLADFSPAGSVGTLRQVTTSRPGGWGGGSTLQTSLRISWGGSSQRVNEYDAKRGRGEHGLPSKHLPSNPAAFVKENVKQPGRPSGAVNAVQLARVIGLTEGDRAFCANKLREAAETIGQKSTAQSVAKDVFAQPHFKDMLANHELPDREDFKDRFVAALNAVLKAHGAQEFALARKDYASGPSVAPAPGDEDREPLVVPTTACFRCHDLKGNGPEEFSPIPRLAFDPFDQAGREAWVKATPAKARGPVLTRMLKRMADDRDMPPEDSAEYGAFRVKNPEQFATVKTWLEGELKNAK
ncbi:MAG: hypothetical protein K2V38_23700, partial [Gemmataceae bacterium]|nr:hypothetical protein [Gemmataceae bacterium]